MRVLILSQYYLPETGAPINRLSSLAENLIAEGCQIEVLTATPNYPTLKVMAGYSNSLRRQTEIVNGVTTHRVPIFLPKNKGTLPRLLMYLSFCLSVLTFSKKKDKFDFIICESPPLFLGISGLILSKLYRSKMIFNVSDLWPESVEALGIIKNKVLLQPAYWLESYIYKKSSYIFGQTESICRNIAERNSGVNPEFLPNGVDIHQFEISNFDSPVCLQSSLEGKVVFFYAGILGYAQGLEVIIKARKELKALNQDAHNRSVFILFGNGPEEQSLIDLNHHLGTDVIFVKSVPRAELLSGLSRFDVGIVPLRKNPLFEGAIPSKLFDSLALGKPILLGVEGEAKDKFIDQVECGLSFLPGDHHSLATEILTLINDPALRVRLGENGRDLVHQEYDRRKIARDVKFRLQRLL